MEDHVPFHVPSVDETDVAGVLDVLRSGWITTGPQCRSFEEAFADHLASPCNLAEPREREQLYCVAVNSCTAALHLGLDAVGVRAGDLVITTPFTFAATAEVVRYFGADPLFVDVDASTGNLTPDAVDYALQTLPQGRRERVRVLMPVHFAGNPCASDEFEQLAQAHELKLVEDAAHALPAARAGQRIGTFGDVTAFSFYATKTLCTGEGGMAVTTDANLAHRMRTMRLHGIDRDAFDRYRKPGGWQYEVIAPGFKYNMPDLMAALGLSQLLRLEQFRDRRAEIAEHYLAELADIAEVTLPHRADPGDTHAWHLFALRVDAELRDAFIEALAEAGIGASVHFVPLHRQPYYRNRYGLKPQDFPVATAWGEQEVSLPIFPAMTDAQVERVVTAVPSALAAAAKAARQ
jgi:dTDP-4-amino-4,6-dideoxygalactose transaminase